jgi:hypothetical protein
MDRDLVKLCVDAYMGKVTNFSAQQTSDAIRAKFVEIMGTDKPDFRTFRNNKNEIFQLIEEVLDQTLVPVITQSPFFNQFVEYRDLNYGDSNVFYVEDRTMLTVSEIADGHLNLRRQKLNIGDSFTVSTKTYGIKIYGDFLRFVSGRLDWSAFVRKVEEALRYKLAEDIATGFAGASQYLPAQFQKSGTFDDGDMADLIAHVSTANGYAPLVIAGTRNALRKLHSTYSTTNSFLVSPNMADQIQQHGILDTYEGVPLMEIPQVFQLNTFDFKLDDNKLYVLPANTKPIKVVREGQTIIVDNPGNGSHMNMDMSMEHTVITKYGVVTIFNTAYGVYNLS